MIYTVSEICRQVRIVMDENGTDEKLLSSGDTDTLELDEIIKSKIEEGVKAVEVAAPVYMLHSGHCFTEETRTDNPDNPAVLEGTETGAFRSGAVYWNGDGSGWILLPDDFCRLVSFKMSDWKRCVHTAIGTDDPQYELQQSEFSGIRGNSEKPVVAIVMRSVGLTLEFYSCDSEDAIVSESDYLPEPKIEDGVIDISEKCFKSCVYHIAALVNVTLGEEKKAETLEQISKSMLV
ncbi:MAG: hypothetical protein ACI4T5_02480 [Prevotella sp.]